LKSKPQESPKYHILALFSIWAWAVPQSRKKNIKSGNTILGFMTICFVFFYKGNNLKLIKYLKIGNVAGCKFQVAGVFGKHERVWDAPEARGLEV
jgi:hypothetical protein